MSKLIYSINTLMLRKSEKNIAVKNEDLTPIFSLLGNDSSALH